MRTPLTHLAFAAAFSVTALNTAVRADVFRNVGLGLQAAGFDIRGQSNRASGGYDFIVLNQFNNRNFDFGAWDLTLDGPLSTQFTTGGRILPNLDIALTTALNSDLDAQPLTYELNYDVGAQATRITGSLLIDTSLNLNAFGFYDLGVTYSTRQNVVNSGTVANTVDDFDSDLGPINIRGNIFADVLATLTDPYFDRANQPNPFEEFSGANQLKVAIQQQGEAILAQVGAGLADASSSSRGLPSTTAFGPQPQSNTAGSGSASANANHRVVPEPPILILMLMGIPAIVLRRHRRA